jgi:hypothetical protein
VDACIASPGGVEGDVESEACGFGDIVFGPLGDEAGEDLRWAEAVAEEVGFGGDYGFGLALVEGEIVDESEDLRDVGWRGFADR